MTNCTKSSDRRATKPFLCQTLSNISAGIGYLRFVSKLITMAALDEQDDYDLDFLEDDDDTIPFGANATNKQLDKEVSMVIDVCRDVGV
jgi:hypothetical protein